MIYLERFVIPEDDQENEFFWHLYRGEFWALPKPQHNNYSKLQESCHNSVYPFHVFTDMSLDSVEFEPITIFYGGNGTGKTTLLNIIAEQLGINRTTPFNRSNFYAAYLQYCKAYCNTDIPPESSIITSDDVFNYILDIRSLNDGIDNRREELFTEYQKYKKKSIGYRFKSLDDYDEFIKVQKARNNTVGLNLY